MGAHAGTDKSAMLPGMAAFDRDTFHKGTFDKSTFDLAVAERAIVDFPFIDFAAFDAPAFDLDQGDRLAVEEDLRSDRRRMPCRSRP